MFYNNLIYVIHQQNDSCIESNVQIKSDAVTDFISKTYPKQKLLPLVFNIIEKQNLIDENLFFIEFPSIHVADVCSFFNNRFGKIQTTDSGYIKLCKYLQSRQIKLPKVGLKNPVAQKYLL